MPEKQLSSAEATLVLDRVDLEPAHREPAPMHYWNPCQAIPPIVIDPPGPFFAAQALVGAFGLAAVAVILLIFEL